MAAAIARRAQRPVEEVVRKLHPGAVHIEIHPRPKNLAESREIMHVVQGYGELSMFKHLKVWVGSMGGKNFGNSEVWGRLTSGR